MIDLDDYPYSQFREAAGTLIGRIVLVLLASCVGAMLGLAMRCRSLGEFWAWVPQLPGVCFFSILLGNGIYVLPLVLIFAFVYVRMELPLWSAGICVVLMWWNVFPLLKNGIGG